MKKNLFSFALIAVAALGLVGCQETSTGPALTDEQVQTYLDQALSNTSICFDNGGGTAFSQTEENKLTGDDFTSVRVAKSLSIRNRDISDERVTVNFTWSYTDDYKDLVFAFGDAGSEGTATHQVLEFDYDAIPLETEAEFKFVGTAAIDGFELTKAVTYTFKLTALTYVYDELPLKNYYDVGEDGRYGFVGKANNDNYYYVKTRGYVIGNAPDGNSAFIADGEHYLQLYAGSANNLTSSTYPALVPGNLVEVRGSCSSYYGNAQLSYVQTIRVVEDSTISQPSGEWAITEEEWGNLYQYDGNQNRAVTITGTYAGNLKNQSGASISSFTPGARCTFEVTFGETTVIVAYNYHVNKESSGIGDEYAEYINAFVAGRTQIKVSGYMLANDGQNSGWIVPDENGISYNSTGEKVTYEIMPFDKGDITMAS